MIHNDEQQDEIVDDLLDDGEFEKITSADFATYPTEGLSVELTVEEQQMLKERNPLPVVDRRMRSMTGLD